MSPEDPQSALPDADSASIRDHLKQIKARIDPIFRHLPLIGPLVDTRRGDHADATKQVVVTLILATTPFWLGSLVLFVTDPMRMSFHDAFFGSIWGGGLFMTATGLLAPVFWVTADDPRGAKAFPSRLSHVLLTVLLSAVASVFFGLGVVNKGLREPFTFHLSVAIFVMATFLLYLSTAYHLRRLPVLPSSPPELYRKDEAEFLSAFEGRHTS